MTDLIEMIDDLHELQKLYVMGDVCFIDFQEKLLKYQDRMDKFEADMNQEFENDYADC